MRLHRFYVIQPLGEEVVIDDISLVSQLTKVFRYTVGDFVILFNGDGYDNWYSIQSISKKTISFIRTKSITSYIPNKNVTLYLSVIKKDAFELVVQKATELGVTSIIPILTSRSEKKNLSLSRLKKIATEASEQSGRGDIPYIGEVMTLNDALLTISPQQTPVMFTIDGEPLLQNIPTVTEKTSSSKVLLFVGPEGGFSDEDKERMKAKEFHEYSLGKTVLRAETAAIVGVSLFCL